MSRPVSAPPMTARVEIVVGTVLSAIGALVLVVHIGSIPGFVVEIVVGFASVKDFWPMVGGAALLAAGIYCLVRGRHGVRRHEQFVARVDAMHEREDERRRQYGLPGVPVAPGAAHDGATYRMPTQL